MSAESRDKFSLERFFRWRCWWDYSTGLSGDLLTHEYDAMNQIMKLGILLQLPLQEVSIILKTEEPYPTCCTQLSNLKIKI